ncbi:MAG: tripartite tricarboxylate transporter substrate binding protein, partial [Rhodospirillales bacterium]|nr:tripartite tricarboxylate transporter substrate binding protein [Rhodospirillales bacterium]
TYPDKPIRLIVPFPAGQAADTFGRLMAERLGARWKQQFVVENKGGGAGIPAMELVAKAAPDGYTLAVGTSGTIGINPSFMKGLMTYDPLVDFAPCSNIFLVPLIIVAHPSHPATSVADLIARAKAAPGKLGYASAGVGSSQHLSMELFKSRAGADIAHVPYKGSGPAMQDLLAGHVTLMMDSVTSSLPHIRAGRVKPLGVTTAKRAPLLPDVPSIGDTVKGFDAAGWSGILAPAKTPREIVEKISADMRAEMAVPEVDKRIIELGGIPHPTTPAEYSAFIKAEIEKWAEVVRISGAKPD